LGNAWIIASPTDVSSGSSISIGSFAPIIGTIRTFLAAKQYHLLYLSRTAGLLHEQVEESRFRKKHAVFIFFTPFLISCHGAILETDGGAQTAPLSAMV
jgi:hypothetical protein